MALDMGRGCPDDERLAEYADGVLGPADRAEIERHLVDCADCRAVIGETMAFQQVHPVAASPKPAVVVPFRSRRWVAGAVAGLAAAAVLALAVRVVRPQWIDGLFGPPGGRPELEELIAALANEPTRPVEGRLTGGFKYAPPPSPTRGPGNREVSPDVRIAAAKIEKLARERDTPQTGAALGLAYLALGDVDRAVEVLEDAAAQQPLDARVQNDLSAAYLARARSLNHAEDYPSALAAAERAIKADPTIVEAWFNRALALEALHLSAEASTAWEDYLRRDGASEWATEARRHSVSRPQTQRNELFRWPQTAEAATAPPEALDAAIRESPQAAREYLEERLVSAWAIAVRDHKDAEAERLAGIGGRVAGTLAVLTGDRFASDAWGVVIDVPPQQATMLADAHSRFDRALGLYAQFRLDQAAPLFATAAAMFRVAKSPFQYRADLGTAIATYYRRDLRLAENQLGSLAASVDKLRYPTLAAQIARTTGLVHVDSGRFDRGLVEYGVAAATFEKTGEKENAASVRSLIAEVLRTLGRSRESWDQQMIALASVDKLSKPRQRESMFLVSALMASERHLHEVSLHFENAALRIAMESDAPAARAQVLVRRADTFERLAQYSDARKDLDAATAWLADVADTSVHERLRSEVLGVRARLLERGGSGEAIPALTEAIDIVARSTIIEWLPSMYLARGRAYAADGNMTSAVDDFQRGIDIFERHRRTVRDEHVRISYFDEAWELVDELVDVRSRHAEPWEAMAATDEARARVLLDDLPRGQPVLRRGWWETLPLTLAVVEFAVLPDRCLAWLATSTRVQQFQLPVPRGSLEHATKRLNAEIRGGAERPPAAAALYEMLLGPFISQVPPQTTLIIIGDGMLNEVPFAALVNAKSHAYLIEEHPLIVAPSARGLLVRDDRRRLVNWQTNPLLFGVHSGGSAPLAAVSGEIAAIKHLFVDASVALGDDATSTRFLEQSSRHGLVHFAGHAVANKDRPLLSRLVFSRSATARDTLYAEELGGLKMPHTKLVVLAACETASGQTSRGEGVLSLARPFLKAGARSVIATLWNVEDRSTSLFFRHFYETLRQRGDVTGSLRAAQIAAIHDSQDDRRLPRHWSAFVHITARDVAATADATEN